MLGSLRFEIFIFAIFCLAGSMDTGVGAITNAIPMCAGWSGFSDSGRESEVGFGARSVLRTPLRGSGAVAEAGLDST
jgi:hypothetical protein